MAHPLRLAAVRLDAHSQTPLAVAPAAARGAHDAVLAGGVRLKHDGLLHQHVAQSHRAAVGPPRSRGRGARIRRDVRRGGGLGGTQPRCARGSGSLPRRRRRLPRRRRRLGRVEPAAGSGRRRRRAAPRGRAGPPRGGAVLGGGGANACLSLRARLTGGCASGSPPGVPRRATRPRARRAPRGGDGRVGFVPAEKLNLRIAADVVVPVRAGEPRGGDDDATAGEPARQPRDAPRRGADEHLRDGGGGGRAPRPDRDATGRSIRETRETPIPAEARGRARGRSRGARDHDRPEDAPGGCRRARRRHQSAHALPVEARASEVSAPHGRALRFFWRQTTKYHMTASSGFVTRSSARFLEQMRPRLPEESSASPARISRTSAPPRIRSSRGTSRRLPSAL